MPVINIGNRQIGKVFPENVIQASYKKEDIKKSINKISSPTFQKKLKKLKNPYEKNISKKKIANLIANLKINKKLKVKKFIDII